MIETRVSEDFLRHITLANVFERSRALRRYQYDIAVTGKLTLLSPFDARTISAIACQVVNLGDPAHGNLGIAYRFDSDRPLWLLADGVKEGFPLSEAYLPVEDRILWSSNDNVIARHASWKSQLRRIEAGGYHWPVEPSSCAPTLLVGHPNFAHHLWNELPALQVYLEAAAREVGPVPLVQALYEPLLPLGQLAQSGSLRVERVKEFKQISGLREGLVTRLGSTQVPAALREQMVGLLAQSVEGRSVLVSQLNALATCSPVFWLSMRIDARTADNQRSFLRALVAAITEAYPSAGFIFDSFSYPVDFDNDIYHQGEPEPGLTHLPRSRGFLGSAMVERESLASAAVNALIDDLRGTFSRPFVSASGRDLAEAITLAGRADYYVCHTGTLQHKVAWLHNIPGTVHTNRQGLWPAAAGWLADKLEGGRAPALVARTRIEDLASVRSRNQVERNRDYHFIDITSVVSDIMTDIGRSLGDAR